MPFERHQRPSLLSKTDRQLLLLEYLKHCSLVGQQNPAALNQKLPRDGAVDVLDRIAVLLREEAALLASRPGPMRTFLDNNPLPECLNGMLPDDFRAFCLLLNALKQWLSAEQAATDRYLLGGRVRQESREATTSCVISGRQLKGTKVELHHPVRDGRPPIPLHWKAHALLEGQKRRKKPARQSRGQQKTKPNL
jgi:hypothetical protein